MLALTSAHLMKRLITAVAIAFTLVLLQGCSTVPDLTSKQAFNLTGQWRLVDQLSDAAPNPRRMMDRMDKEVARRGPTRGAQKVRMQGALFAFVNQDFPVLSAEKMLVEQNVDSMGIDYKPGRYRDVTWGERERGLWRVYAGWDDEDRLVIDSRGNDIRARETMHLRSDGLLEVQVDVHSKQRDFSVLRVFERVK